MSTHSPLDAQLSSSWTWARLTPAWTTPTSRNSRPRVKATFKQRATVAITLRGQSDVFPADDAHVTSVGGTDLVTSGPAGTWVSETVWVDGGGGYFTTDGIALPSWQHLSGVITTANQGSATYRNAPDVAAESNFDYLRLRRPNHLHGQLLWRHQFRDAALGRLHGSGQSAGGRQRRMR